MGGSTNRRLEAVDSHAHTDAMIARHIRRRRCMIEHLKRIISRLRSSGTWSLLDLQQIHPRKQLFPPLSPPEDPAIGVREPKWRRPTGNSAAVAVAEPEDHREGIEAISRTGNAAADGR